jgi:hypothetical protein
MHGPHDPWKILKRAKTRNIYAHKEYRDSLYRMTFFPRVGVKGLAEILVLVRASCSPLRWLQMKKPPQSVRNCLL